MNEQIKELVKQAESAANEVLDFEGKGYYDIVMAKFAELIVRECAGIADAHDGQSDYMQLFAPHFGVKECQNYF